MSEVLAPPSIPPISPWEGYLIIIFVPFLLRLIFVAPPLLDLVQTYAPKGDRAKHARWFIDRIKRLPVQGFWLIVLNEVLAFVLPAFLALAARVYVGPIGWDDWDIPLLGITLLVVSGLAWIGVDFGRVAQSRMDIRRLGQLNLDVAKQTVDTAVYGREMLQTVKEFRIPRPWKSDSEEGGSGNPVMGLVSGVLDLGVDVLDFALDQVRVPAGDAIDKIDSEIQSRIQERVRASKRSLATGTLFSLFPLVVLLGLPRLF
ncbi:MAG TPA: hypothetical protein QF641_00650 [Candidatus Thalassarchaeaceae archaeon]|jgi:hypothetical protein|nr:hypothetical protein [Candidatus Thalassarchaeaceae archaeon]|tara:strand:- start:8647 stop:9423 length:777 start_codon:yes stop_codon:yes gene_type:complete